MVMYPRILKKKKCSYVLIIFLLGFLILQSVLIPVQALENTLISIDPSTQTVSPGGSFTIDVYCVPRQPIKAFEFTINFNPTLVRANSVSEGEIFNGYTTFFNNGSIDNTGGTIENIYGLILGSGSVSSSGTFVSVSFTAKSTPGNSAINLNNVGVTNNSGYIQTVVSGGNVQVIVANQPPMFTSLLLANNSINIPITRNSLGVTIRDPEGDHFDYTIQTSPNVGRVSIQNAVNGTKTCSISGLSYGTVYRCYINATDGTHWTRRWYRFTTAPASVNNPLLFSSMSPSNGSTNVPIGTLVLSLLIRDPEGKSFDYTIQTSPDIGHVSVHTAYNGTKQCTISGLTHSTTYRWYVNATDGVTSIKKWFIFTTVTQNTSGDSSSGVNNGETPPDDNESPTPPEQNNPPHSPTQPNGPTLIQPGVIYTFSSHTYDPDGDHIRLLFNWGDKTYSEWTAFTPSNMTVNFTHSWSNISSYSVTVLAQDENGSYSTWSDPLIITVTQQNSEEEPTTFYITALLNISDNHTCQFNITGTIPLNSENISYYWEFGDGATATEETPFHLYKNPGVYTVILTITDDFGNIYKKTITLTIPSYSQNTAQEKQSSLLPYVYIPVIALLSLFLILVVKFFKKKTKAYSSKTHVHPQQKTYSLPPQKFNANTLTNEPKPIIKNNFSVGKITLDHPSYLFTDDIEKKVDDILRYRKMHETIDKL